MIKKTSIPLVSVVVPSYNHARFLRQRLDSILEQTFTDYELISLDDYSTDNSREVLESYAARCEMRLVIGEENSGSPFIQWRRGAQMAYGKYLWIAESDDYADPRFLEVLVAMLEGHSAAGLAYCQSYGVDEGGTVWGSWEYWTHALDPNRWKSDFVNSGRDEVANYLVQRNTIPNGSAVLVERELFLEACEGAETMRLAGDWWTWSRVLMRKDVAFVAEPLNYFRSHVDSMRETTIAPLACSEEFAVIGHICSRVSVSKEIRHLVFHETFYKLRKWFYATGEWPGSKLLRRMCWEARRVRRWAPAIMAWFFAKQLLKRVSIIGKIVKMAKGSDNGWRPHENGTAE